MKFKEIKKWLIDNGLTQTEIAKKAGVTQSTVGLVIRGRSTSKNITSILLGLGCPQEFLTKEAV